MTAEAGGAPFVTGVLLAAGLSRRSGVGPPKQLRDVEGQPLVRRAARAALASRLRQVILVAGHREDAVRAAVADLPLQIVANPRFADGQSTSVRCGLAAVDPRASGALFVPVDQPRLDAPLLDRMIAAHAAHPGRLLVPVHGRRRGAPVLWDRSLFAELDTVRGDEGGRQLFPRLAWAIVEVPVDDPAALVDVDR